LSGGLESGFDQSISATLKKTNPSVLKKTDPCDAQQVEKMTAVGDKYSFRRVAET
jgi:hypothetical protein